MWARTWVLAASIGGCIAAPSATDPSPGPDLWAPELRLSAVDVDFGEQPVGQEAPRRELIVENVGDTELVLLDVVLPEEQTGFFLEPNPVGKRLEPGRAATVAVRWIPRRLGDSVGDVLLFTNAGTDGVSVGVRGTAVTGVLEVEPLLLQLTKQNPDGPLSFVNRGGASVQILEVSIEGDPGFQVDLMPARNGELPFELSPVNPDTGLPKREVRVVWDAALSDGTAKASVWIRSDGYQADPVEVVVEAY